MSWIMIVLLLVASFLILVPMFSYLSAKRLVGRKIDSNLNGNRMLYFYSQRCSPCRAMTPIIDRLARQYEGIVKVDVREDPETSRTFNIRATPTLVMMKDNVVTQVALGAKTESQLETMLKKHA
ncbi:MAG: thioredoxin family protein [Candidatus Thiodiazotropha sp. (ex. Lucinisca nassula)]|nr:thioredoxin family protein [Candidatus Thiodiazotropha sp. (ex. Lucinisca nassula)]MBW9274024.1 thioredoxin family protein [Candidatus Thiodiazotropha sp. (ex. Lucinisca nassula)]PUB81734.1 MAG: thioredoxin [gamma proteobacterium symbiont of Ctena orbiculata]